MKLKKEYLILAVVIVALSVYLIMRTTDRAQYLLPEVPSVAAKDISRLQITRNTVETVISQQDEKWYIGPEKWLADEIKIQDMLKAIENLTLTALVSESRNYNLYDLDTEKKINVKAWQGETLKRDVDIGKTASSFRHTFVKTAGDERVYHARGNFRNNFDVTADDLRDKVVLSLNTAENQQIQLIKDQQSLTLNSTPVPVAVDGTSTDKKPPAAVKSSQPMWQAADGRPVDEAVVKQILAAVTNMRCEKYINDRQKTDFTSPLLTLQLKGAQEYSLSIFAKTAEEDTNYPAASSGSDYPFLLSAGQADQIMKDPIKAPKPPETSDEKSK